MTTSPAVALSSASRPSGIAIAEFLRSLPVGGCSIRFGCLIWRTSFVGYVVGRDAIRTTDVAYTLPAAIAAIKTASE